MEKYIMLKDQNTQHCYDVNIDPQIQCNLYQIPIGFVIEIDKMILKFIWKSKGPRIAKIILRGWGGGEKKEQSWSTSTT